MTAMKFERLVDMCIEARRAMERGEVEFLEFIERAEIEHADVWKTHCASFTEFLQVHIGKPEPRRYANFKEAVVAIGRDEVRRIGIDAAVQAMRVPEPESRQKLVVAAR